MNYKQSANSTLLVPVSYQEKNLETLEYGEGRRVSMPFNQRRETYYTRVHPDANGTLRSATISTRNLANKPIKDVIRTLAHNAAAMSDSFDLYRQYINSGHEWETESTADERRLQQLEERVTEGGTSFQTILDKFIFGMLIEGAFCGEATGNLVEGITAIDPISPFEVTFVQEEDPILNVVDIIGQGVGKNFVALQDPRNPNPYFIYDPVISDPVEPWGKIPFLPGIAAEIMHSELFTKTDQYLEGQIFPKGYFSFDFSSAAQAGIPAQTIIKWTNEAINNLKNNMANADPTQAVISTIPTVWSLVGGLGKVNLDGLELLDRMISRTFQRAYKVPAFLFPSGDSGGALSDGYRTQLLMWLRRIRNYQRRPNEALTQWGNIHLSITGSRNKCRFKLDDTDLEGKRLEAEKDQLEATARKTQAEADQLYITMGVISRQEVRTNLRVNDPRYANIVETALPEMPALPAPQQTDQQTGEAETQTT